MINVVVIGFGAMGQQTVEELQKSNYVEVVGIIDNDPKFNNKFANTYIESVSKIPIHPSIDEIDWESIQLAIVSAASFFKQIAPLLEELVERKVNVITIAEELTEPFSANEKIATSLHEKAQENNVSIFGTGINPGFVFDLFLLTLTAPMVDIKRIKATRINDLSPFGRTVFDSQGIGLSPEDFIEKVASGEVVGHVGFKQSIKIIEKALHWTMLEYKENLLPIIGEEDVVIDDIHLKKGMVVGCNHIVHAIFAEDKEIYFEHPQQVFKDNKANTRDEITIEGTPTINLQMTPEIEGGVGTVAMIINTIPLVLKAKPGIITILDLPRIPYYYARQ